MSSFFLMRAVPLLVRPGGFELPHRQAVICAPSRCSLDATLARYAQNWSARGRQTGAIHHDLLLLRVGAKMRRDRFTTVGDQVT